MSHNEFIPKIWAEKLMAVTLVSPTLLGRDDRTPEEREAARLRYRAAQAEAREVWGHASAILDAVTDPVARAVLDLHGPDDYGRCSGCECWGYDAEAARHPCSTVHVVAGVLGVAMPDPDVSL